MNYYKQKLIYKKTWSTHTPQTEVTSKRPHHKYKEVTIGVVCDEQRMIKGFRF